MSNAEIQVFMRILFIQSYLGRREPPVAPLGLASLAANLPNHDCRIFDPNVATDPHEETRAIIKAYTPDIVALSLRNIDTTKYSDQFLYFEYFRRYVEFVKEVDKNPLIVVGGSGFSLFPRRIMEMVTEIDVGFTLEAEVSFQNFLDNNGRPDNIKGVVYRNEGSVVSTGFPDLVDVKEIAPPAWDMVDLTAYLPYTTRASIGLETKRGCALACSYCTYPVISGSEVKQKRPAAVVDELVKLKEKHGVDRIFFCDPVFNYPLDHSKSICREILDRGLQIKWGAYHQDRFIDEEYIDLALAAGCDDFYFSPDAASSEGLQVLNKASSVDSLKRSVEIIKSRGQAKASYNFFAAVPGIGWKNFGAALQFLISTRWKLGSRLVRWKLSYIRIEPETEITKLVLGADHIRNEELLLPVSKKQLRQLFVRKTSSKLLNILLFFHFYTGALFGRKNVIRQD
ncbi:hypothetical protein CEE37_09340 [candidate division LCP-89 bacterium B3_LCP]|uniref:B12-binding domain-containing protein n=1 Tax=candidate division LCP-89 bacterium B3_LCP TaxID=2012998 RepID=A0A532UYA8_UNCL8|nr:MAG: hypothetical protein CEE37_09340 [candidate division LCP-89 bacterium B3_LCP]